MYGDMKMDVLAVIGEIVLYSVGVFFVFIMMMVGLVVVMEFISKNTNDTKTIIIRINTITNKVKDIMPSFFSKIVQYVQKPTLITKKVFDISHLLSKNIIVHIKELRKSILPNTGKICIAILIFSVAYIGA